MPSRRATRGELIVTARPGDFERAGVGTVVAVEDLAERTLAGAILTEQGDNLAWIGREFGDIVCEQRSETLDDALGLDERSDFVQRRPPSTNIAWRFFARGIDIGSPARPQNAALQRIMAVRSHMRK